MGTKRNKAVDFDITLQIGIMTGAEWSVTEIGQHFGVTSQAINMRKLRDKDKLIERAAIWTRTAISKHIEDRIKAAEDEIDHKKKRIHKKAYTVIEKTLDHGLRESEAIEDPETGELISVDASEPSMIHLKAAEMAIDRVEGKALDRKAIMSRMDVYRHEVDGGDLDDVLNETAKINEMRRLALPPAPEPETT